LSGLRVVPVAGGNLETFSGIDADLAERARPNSGLWAGLFNQFQFLHTTGRITAWIEVGMPDAQRLHRGLKLAGRAAVYTHRDVQRLLAQLSAANIDRLGTVPVYEFERAFIDEVAGLLERRSELSISITEREVYLEISGSTFTTTIAEYRAR
jgi:uncharacterized protein YaeQ